jgi:hypothetical protein
MAARSTFLQYRRQRLHIDNIAATSAFQEYSGNICIIQCLASKCSTNTFEINLYSGNTELSDEPPKFYKWADYFGENKTRGT